MKNPENQLGVPAEDVEGFKGKETEYPSKTEHFQVKGCDVTWVKSKEPAHGATIGKRISIYGKKSPGLAWILAHELAHALESEEKKPPESHGSVQLNDVQSGRHKFPREQEHKRKAKPGKHYYPRMSAEEFHASRRSKNYVKLACGALGISLESAILSDPPEHLKSWWDRGYFYQWRVQVEERNKRTDKRMKRVASAQARFERQKPLADDSDTNKAD